MATNGPQTPYAPQVPGFSNEENKTLWPVLDKLLSRQIDKKDVAPLLKEHTITGNRWLEYYRTVGPKYKLLKPECDKMDRLNASREELSQRERDIEDSISASREASIQKAVNSV